MASVSAPEVAGQAAQKADMAEPLKRHNTAGESSLALPGESVEVVVTKR
jgi:hypothetical protein